MKKLFFMAALCMLALSVNAQINPQDKVFRSSGVRESPNNVKIEFYAPSDKTMEFNEIAKDSVFNLSLKGEPIEYCVYQDAKKCYMTLKTECNERIKITFKDYLLKKSPRENWERVIIYTKEGYELKIMFKTKK